MADDWRVLDVVELPPGGQREAWAALVTSHPELRDVAERDIRVDVVCGRDGISRIRFAVRTVPTPEPPPRHLP